MTAPPYFLGVDLGRDDQTVVVVAERHKDLIHLLRNFYGPNAVKNAVRWMRRREAKKQ